MTNLFLKDLTLVSFINFAMTLNHLGTILFPYYLSMVHQENPNVTSQDLFPALFFMYIGCSVGSNLVPRLIRIIGYKSIVLFTLCFYYLYIKIWTY